MSTDRVHSAPPRWKSAPETVTGPSPEGVVDPQNALIDRLYDTYRRLGLPAPFEGPRKPSYFYAIQVDDRIKLGRSLNPAARVNGLQLPGKPVVLVTAPEWIISEVEAHERWAHLRVHREWFKAEPDLIAWLTTDLAKRVAEKEAVAARLDALRDAMNAPVRPLRSLDQIERRIAKESAAEEKRLLKLLSDQRYQTEKALGCGLCGEQKTLYDVGLPRYVCSACRTWFNLGVPHAERQAFNEAYELRRQATTAIELHRCRVTRLEQMRSGR